MTAPSTRPSLLMRLADSADAEAWETFVEIYTPLLRALATRWQGQSADVDDLVQDVLSAVSSGIEDFNPQRRGSFRAWLAVITRRKLIDQLKKRVRSPVNTGGTDFQAWLQEQTGDGRRPSSEPESRWDIEQQRAVFLWAANKVRHQVQPRTWQAFHLTSIDGLSIEDVADRLDGSVGWVYVARSRVLSRLQKAVAAWDTTLAFPEQETP